jgi:hypothetical protein
VKYVFACVVGRNRRRMQDVQSSDKDMADTLYLTAKESGYEVVLYGTAVIRMKC